ncbi:hypothetical protein SLEP1_g13612 [Rubroshorea leprosula]|uniref:Uncharacterized protein n=1 Tax=Rubroshorea leprosula TaxID=152421 RepID=A0AAV5ISZ6_9ROSI|nr:hypothetical protein SLEP1_g13612 [Rubroshorea leprosula]
MAICPDPREVPSPPFAGTGTGTGTGTNSPAPRGPVDIPRVPTCSVSCSVPVKRTMMKKRKMRLQMIKTRMEVRRKMDLVRMVNNKKEKGKEREKERVVLGAFGVNKK